MAEIVIDFDGTCVTHDYPNIGKEIGSVSVLKKLVESGHRLILFTMRSDMQSPQNEQGEEINFQSGLTDAVNWFKTNEIPLYGIQTNPTQKSWTESPKAYGHLIIDDAALGCPLTYDGSISNRPFVDWVEVERQLQLMMLLK